MTSTVATFASSPPFHARPQQDPALHFRSLVQIPVTIPLMLPPLVKNFRRDVIAMIIRLIVPILLGRHLRAHGSPGLVELIESSRSGESSGDLNRSTLPLNPNLLGNLPIAPSPSRSSEWAGSPASVSIEIPESSHRGHPPAASPGAAVLSRHHGETSQPVNYNPRGIGPGISVFSGITDPERQCNTCSHLMDLNPGRFDNVSGCLPCGHVHHFSCILKLISWKGPMGVQCLTCERSADYVEFNWTTDHVGDRIELPSATTDSDVPTGTVAGTSTSPAITDSEQPCMICLEPLDFNRGRFDNVLGRLPCAHVYHILCILKWLSTKGPRGLNCPACRTRADYVELQWTTNRVSNRVELPRGIDDVTIATVTDVQPEPSIRSSLLRKFCRFICLMSLMGFVGSTSFLVYFLVRAGLL